MTTKLENALLRQMHDPPTGKNRYNAHETLDALITVAAPAIYNFADDRGAALAALEGQFVERLHERILAYDHDPAYHDGDPHYRDETQH